MNFFSNILKLDFKKNNLIEGLTDESIPLYVYNLFKHNNNGILIVTSTLYEANKLYNLLSGYTKDVLFFPVDEFITQMIAHISPEQKSIRLSTINELITDSNKIVVTHLLGYIKYLPNKKQNENNVLKIQTNKTLVRETLIENLIDIGYEKTSLVSKTGEFANRGFILDIFPINEENPIRIEFFDDEIERISYFDVNTQLSLKNINSIDIYNFNENSINIKNNSYLLEYINNPTTVFVDYPQIKNNYQNLNNEIYEYNLRNQINKKYMFEFEEIISKENKYILKTDNIIKDLEHESKINIKISSINPYLSNVEEIKNSIEDYIKKNKTVILCFSTELQIKNFYNKIYDKAIITNENKIYTNKINLIKKNIVNGFIYNDIVVITDTDLFGIKEEIKYKSKYKYGTKIKDINKLSIDDYVVHTIHGIGIYKGLTTINKLGVLKDYLKIIYKDNDILYVPVEKISMISKYSDGGSIVPKISALGGKDWEKLKNKAKNRIQINASELLKLYANREMAVGYAFGKDNEDQYLFEKEFIYNPTVDQLISIKQIKEDMESKKPMDRLLCGDVGFGKTEVAFRAAFKAINDGKQVAYLCPTTILSSQHYKNSLERFRNFPINISLLNRFVSSANTNKIINNLKEGKIDFIIGTHKLLGKDIIFKDLGLLIIDEEQRFGVRQKEKIKSLKNNIDVLSLSATPIPRSLQMSVSGIRSLSLIETPPMDRYPIQTYVLEENNYIIKDAIYKEITRGGQVFILYNNVEKIEQKSNEIKSLVKEARVTYIHGKMNSVQIESVMTKFIGGVYDVLVCTTIIETGIDIVKANTLIVLDADRFGLSQLYQIRGRIGRGNLVAYSYLMYKKDKVITEVAQKRLEAIKEFTSLGSGFKLAMRDLSIRGAGDLLGSDQAGFIDAIGIELYLKMLNEEIKKLKGIKIEEEIEEKPLIDINTHIKDEYVSDSNIKIEIHNLINTIDSYEKLLDIKYEIEDRFGKIDNDILIYMYQEWLEKISNNIGIEKFVQKKEKIEVIFSKELSIKVDGEKLFYKAYSINKKFKLEYKNDKIIVILNILYLDKHWIYYLIDLLSSYEYYLK